MREHLYTLGSFFMSDTFYERHIIYSSKILKYRCVDSLTYKVFNHHFSNQCGTSPYFVSQTLLTQTIFFNIIKPCNNNLNT